MRKLIYAALAALMLTPVFAQEAPQFAATPQMGWNSWNKFAMNINEDLIKATADKMVELGLVDAGYIYLNLDDGWHGERDEQGFIHEDPEKFPSGIKALADYVHSKGMKLGIYSDAGWKTCGGCAGSFGHEFQDAYTYAQWGVDYLKYDWCYTEEIIHPKGAYKLMSVALKATGRPIWFSMCEWGSNKPWEWGAEYAQSWRTTGDIWPYFDSIPAEFEGQWHGLPVMEIVDLNEPLRAYSGPGHWNDPDMLEVGNGQLTLAENRAHFTLWCMMAAPLLMGNDLTTMSDDILQILINKDVIAIDQDPLGIQGLRLKREGDVEYWFKPLAGGDWAFCLLNRGAEDAVVNVDWGLLSFTDELSGLSFDPTGLWARNLWDSKARVRKTKGIQKITVPTHDVVLYRIGKK
ncbi:MAG: glycoside hydrolase family 27 protein [Bacteroidales bacterium]|nr:glycoside hydrolase family 27 protein [Bacteroidales bacterium]